MGIPSTGALAKTIGVEAETLSSLFNGTTIPNRRSLPRYAKFLGLSHQAFVSTYLTPEPGSEKVSDHSYENSKTAYEQAIIQNFLGPIPYRLIQTLLALDTHQGSIAAIEELALTLLTAKSSDHLLRLVQTLPTLNAAQIGAIEATTRALLAPSSDVPVPASLLPLAHHRRKAAKTSTTRIAQAHARRGKAMRKTPSAQRLAHQLPAADPPNPAVPTDPPAPATQG